MEKKKIRLKHAPKEPKDDVLSDICISQNHPSSLYISQCSKRRREGERNGSADEELEPQSEFYGNFRRPSR